MACFNKTVLQLSLLFVCVMSLPIGTCIVIFHFISGLFSEPEYERLRKESRKALLFQECSVLIVGAKSPESLVLARKLYAAGHRICVIGFEDWHFLDYVHLSRSIQSYYNLAAPTSVHDSVDFIKSLERIVCGRDIELLVFCTDEISLADRARAGAILMRRTGCKAFHFDSAKTSLLVDPCKLAEYAATRGLPTLETHRVYSRTDAHRILDGARKRQKVYKVQPLDSPDAEAAELQSLVLPLQTVSKTYSCVSKLKIGKSKSWLLREHVMGESVFTQTLVIRGEILAFLAWQNNLGLSFTSKPCRDQQLNASLMRYMEDFIDRDEAWTGYLYVEFRTFEVRMRTHLERRFVPISADTKPRNAFLRSMSTKQNDILVDAHLRAIDRYMPKALAPPLSEMQQSSRDSLVDLVTMNLCLLARTAWGGYCLSTLLVGVRAIEQHVAIWDGSTFDRADPLPWWAKQHILMPYILVGQLFETIKDFLGIPRMR